MSCASRAGSSGGGEMTDQQQMEMDSEATLDVGERARRYLAQHGRVSSRKGNGGDLQTASI